MDDPHEGDERSVLLGWLGYHREVLAVKCAGLSAAQLVERASPPSKLTLLGLVRHLTEMERVYAAYAMGPAGDLMFVYGPYDDGGPEGDFDVDATMVEASFANWNAERKSADAVIVSCDSLDERGGGNGRSARWNLQKLVGEYARHNGHADMLRERIDGSTGQS